MLKQRAFLLLALCCAVPAQAGLFSDDEARTQIQQLEALVQQLERRASRQETFAEQQSKSILDLLGQIEMLGSEIRKLRGQNEELAHGLQNAEKREKDFYVDLDTRLRRFEPTENSAQAGSETPAETMPADPDDPVSENRAFEAAYALFKGGSHANAIRLFREFIGKYPGSVHTPNANYWLGNAQFVLKDYAGALETYQGLIKSFPDTTKAADVLFGIAGCQMELKQEAVAKKTLKQDNDAYPY